jgi:hypothetical protein
VSLVSVPLEESREVLSSTVNIPFRDKGVSDPHHASGSRHQLHQTLRSLRGESSWVESGLYVNDGFDEVRIHAMSPSRLVDGPFVRGRRVQSSTTFQSALSVIRKSVGSRGKNLRLLPLGWLLRGKANDPTWLTDNVYLSIRGMGR